MKTIICSIYDSAIQAYMRPFTSQTTGQAVRMFKDEIERDESDMGKHSEDYSLFHLADFTDHDGAITRLPTPLCLAKAHELKALQQNGQVITPIIPGQTNAK